MDNNRSNEDYFLNDTFNFDEPFDFDSSNYDQGSDAKLYRSGRPARPQLFLDTATPFVDEDQPFVTAYTGHEMTYQELLGEQDRQNGATVDAPVAAGSDYTTRPPPHEHNGFLKQRPTVSGANQATIITGVPQSLATTDNYTPDDDNNINVVQHNSRPDNAQPMISASNSQAERTHIGIRQLPATSGDGEPSGTSADIQANDNTQSTDGAKMRKSCVRCHTRKMKCIIIEGSTPKLCTECHKKELVCEFEQKKPYIRKPTASSQ